MTLDKEQQRKDIEKFIRKMPSLSTTVGKVMEVCSRTDASPNELNKVVSLDPVLTGQVLKLINSAYYSLVDKVTTLTRAITMLGMNTVKNMALSTAIIKTVGGVKKSRVIPTTKFWQHSIGVGVSAKLYAAIQDMPVMEREGLFVAGLLHDLGKIPFGDEYIQVVDMARNEQIPLIEAEREIMGIDHQEVGRMIAEKWKLNEEITNCISQHHNIAAISGDSTKRIGYVALGNMYTDILDVGFAGSSFPRESEVTQLLELLGLTMADFGSIGEDVQKEIQRAEMFLQI